jgi:hypothetical protein
MCVCGRVDTDHVCMCGRPAVMAIADTLTCLQATCIDAVIKPMEKKPDAPADNWEGGSAEEWMAWRYRGMM